MYGFLDQFVGHGLVGGYLYQSGQLGKEAAGLVLKILSGRKPRDVPLIAPAASATQFDARQLERWKINEDRLPPRKHGLVPRTDGLGALPGMDHRRSFDLHSAGTAYHRDAR